MVRADFEPAIFCVALFKHCPVSLIAPLIDCDASLDGVVAFVRACAEPIPAIVADDNVIPKNIIVAKAIGMITLTIVTTMLT